MKYLYDLKTAGDKMLKYPELQDIESMNAKDKENQYVQKLTILTQCLGITKPNNITCKTELVHKITTVYKNVYTISIQDIQNQQILSTLTNAQSIEERVHKAVHFFRLFPNS